MPNIGGTEMLIILAVVLLLFGSAKLPTLARSLGKSARILKAETKGLHSDDEETAQAGQDKGQQSAQQQPAQQPAAQEPSPLPPGQPIQGVPVDPDQVRRST